MLEITVGAEGYDESTEEFRVVDGVTLQFEHSLVSLSKWEEVFERPFLGKQQKTTDEMLFYVRCMLVTPEVPEEVFNKLSKENFEAINTYIDAKRTGTTFHDLSSKGGTGETITSELMYYWMTVYNIPFECDRWHLNRLITLIRICNIKQEKPKKMSKGDAARQRQELNAKRKAAMGTRG